MSPVPEFIDPVFTKTSPKRSFSLNRKRAFWLVFVKTGSIISGTGHFLRVSTLAIFKPKKGDRPRYSKDSCADENSGTEVAPRMLLDMNMNIN